MQIMLSLCQLVFSSIISIRKLIGGLYQDEVTLNLTFTRRLGYTKPTTVKWSVIFHLTTEYQNYVSLNTADRKITYPDHSHACESGLGPGWFRFEGSAGARMPTPCPAYDRCDTDATTWINGSHITVADGQVSRQVCFIGHQAAVNGQQTSKWGIVVHILCIILVVHLFVLSVIVELTKQNVHTKYYHITSPHK